ncbi:MAG: Repressor in ring oxydation complex/ phenylacetic acid degradation pathway related protein (PaaX) [Parcubacteria group bacterium GW2011_GWA1_36_12]|nr:MAG: Repressor in ring oxydation complex/ phenylacetic acid degradation pathway related protein (PaaX) [Parcubacteria group bacterium GW2011_GWA1_36_12]
MNKIKEKILLLLLGGLAFGCSYTFGKQRMVLRTVSREWRKLNSKELRRGINYLYRLKFVDKKESENGLITLLITEKGKLKALNYQLENIRNKKEKWDRRWRMVAFDIPEKYKRERDALRQKLKKIGFCELQKSVLITPFNCKKEIKLLVKYFDLSKYVRFGVLEYIDNENYLKKVFKLS